MSYNGSGTFQINSTGQPVVSGTVISSTAFNALTADLATGLSTAITKDGQTATTARIPFAAGINSTLVTDSASTTTGSIITAGGVGIAKALYVGTTANFGGVATYSAQPIFSSLTASSAVATDASKGLVSVTNTGTGNNVLGTGPTVSLPVIDNIKMGYSTTATAAGTTTFTAASNYRQFFTGTLAQTIVLPVTSTLVVGIAYEIENNSTGTLTVNSSGGNLVGTVPAGVCAHAVCIGTTLTTAADWDWDYISNTSITGTGSAVLSNSPTLVTPALGTPTALVGTNITGTATAFNINGTVGATTATTGAFTSVTASTTGKIGTTLGVGNATPSASGSGITFPATQSASSDANTLDDYEEGTWTPGQGSGLTVVGAYSSSGQYTKIGRSVTVFGLIAGATSVACTANGQLCTGLPFTPNTEFQGALINGNRSFSNNVGALGSGNVQNSTVLAATSTAAFTITYFV